MDKNWLIRTKSNHILGPISKEKVVELYKNGSIKADDEVCCGNGYWFFIREDEMVERFLTGNEIQTFNPISEAKDVLTHGVQSRMTEAPANDITMVGGINLSMLKQPAASNGATVPPVPDVPAPTHKSPATKETVSSETKKKNNVVVKPRSAKVQKPLKKQNFIKYIGVFGFIVLLLLVYFRKSIIQSLFQGEITSSFSIIAPAHAQEDVPGKKKRLLESTLPFEKVVFKPVVSLDGFKVTSSFEINDMTCQDLNNEVYQLAVILYPPEVINEQFMIRLRDCVIKLPESHPVKKWMKWVASSRPLKADDLQKRTFLMEIINSQFNLITDTKVKNDIIKSLQAIPENTIAEKILKSYLYLMIGNITRSDNILREIMAAAPRVNWERTGLRPSMHHKLAVEQAQQIFTKLGKHPADRRVFELFGLYLQSFYNDEPLVAMADDIDTSEIESKLELRFIEGLAPQFVHYLRLSNFNDAKRIKSLRNFKKYPLEEQSYWFWAFFEIDPLVSDALHPELLRLEKEDQLWFIFLMDNEKLSDLFNKKSGKSFLPGRRPYLKESLNDHHTFMMALYKLIELGDINHELIVKTADQIIHD